MEKIDNLKFGLLIFLVGALLGVISEVVKQSFNIESYTGNIVGGVIIGLGITIAILLVKSRIRRGGCKWLLKEQS